MGKFRFKSCLTISILLAVLVLSMASQAGATEYWKQKFIRFSATAGETLATGDVVFIYSVDSRAYKADRDAGEIPVVGMIGDKGGAAGETVEIVVAGILAGQTAVSPGTKLYLGSGGAITTAVSGRTQYLGTAIPSSSYASSTTVYLINIGEILEPTETSDY